MVPDLVRHQPPRIFPGDNPFRNKPGKEFLGEHFVQRPDRLGRDKHSNVIGRPVNEVGSLPGSRRHHEQIAQLLVFLVERFDDTIRMVGVETRHLFVEQVTFARNLLVPDQHVLSRVDFVPTSSEQKDSRQHL